MADNQAGSTKRCNKCKAVKPVSEFGIEARAKNGYKPRCKECTNEYDRAFYRKGYKEIKISRVMQYYKENAESICVKVNEYAKNNREKKNIYAKKYRGYRIETDPEFRLKEIMRGQVRGCIVRKSEYTETLLGYTFRDLINHLGEVPGKGENIDHKIPLSWFKSGTEIKILFHLHNLQILPVKENNKKGNKFCHPVTFDYYNTAINHIKPEFKNLLQYVN